MFHAPLCFLLIFLSLTNQAFGQAAIPDTPKEKKFLILANAGCGSNFVYGVDGHDLKGDGYSFINSTMEGEFLIGYRFLKNLSIISGIRAENLSPEFIYKNERYSYSGGRLSVPVYLRVTYSDKPFTPFGYLGLVYTIHDGLSPIQKTPTGNLSENPFKNMAYKVALGFAYTPPKSNWQYTIQFNGLGDFERENKISLEGFSIDLGFAYALF